jgi:hypothetical protein
MQRKNKRSAVLVMQNEMGSGFASAAHFILQQRQIKLFKN